MIQLLLSHQPDLEARDAMGWTSLMVACEYAESEVLQRPRFPIQYNHVNERANFKAASGRLEAVHELLNAGAQADAANEKGQTSL